MLLSKISKFCKGNYLNVIRSTHKLSSATETDIQTLPKQDPQVTQSSSGITVVSVENYSPITNVSVIIKAGARYETSDNLGIVHCLRNCSPLSTENNSSFIITRNLEMLSAKIGVTSSRENLIYTLQVGRDNLEPGLEILADMICNPAFKTWEVEDIVPKQHLDLAMLKNQPDAILMETLHKAAFKGGLKNSLFAEEFLIGKHSVDMLHDYVEQNFTASRCAVVGLGVPHEHLQKNIDDLFSSLNKSSGIDSPSKFSAGEVRIEANYPYVHTAIVAEGAGLMNLKETLSLGVLQCMLGLGPHINLSDTSFSKLGAAGAKCTSNPFSVSSINLNYSDTGLFGVHLVGQPSDMAQLVKAIISEMRSVPKCINDNAVQLAKHKLKAKLLIERDTLCGMLDSIVPEVSVLGGMRDTQEVEKTIDELKTSDIASIASKVLKAKPAMASVGRLHSTPYIDELL